MLIFVVQTLAEILAGGTSLTSTEQIDFSHPIHRREEGTIPTLNLYVYDLRESKHIQHSGRQVERKLTSDLQPATINWSPSWFDVSILLTAWDRTALGEHHLLSEALNVLLRHRSLQEDFLVPELRGYGNLSMTVAVDPPIEIGSLWSALNVPLRTGLYLTVTVPLEPQATVVPLVWERIFNLQNQNHVNGNNPVVTRRVAIAGMVKSAVDNQPLVDATVAVLTTERSVVCNKEGIFFFENLRIGNYVLTVNCPGYLPQNVNVLVDNQGYAFKEIVLTPE
ncbi:MULTISPECIES: Pvc16 family protein [Cyanophyceae]|uniref:Pvc16 family protein n=1 Tax=Cyanophyceae TaxID=3028117 RepID=UPI00232F4FEC|nr:MULTISPECIES: Pvc16 family protein [Cyanophyceae]MDB9355756.1 Pvc16 family protein [Nodularia spumigena CS-587/03]MDB9341353.1 Pvc16 family protein [Nodularia spumigena CS-589/07]MDB9399160.1 Pvc16 family protein [Microcystis aeruginosa CS-567/02-A1]MDB9500205.1 Pvc16 family protein [Nodularia spumigena CS-336/02]MDB9533471.1 Pvc16 family protein [Nodularia spumigena CS-1038]